MAAPAASPRVPSARPAAVPAPPPLESEALRREIAILREQVDGMEGIISSQVRALRSLLELLIEAGLLTREEYLERIHRHE